MAKGDLKLTSWNDSTYVLLLVLSILFGSCWAIKTNY